MKRYRNVSNNINPEGVNEKDKDMKFRIGDIVECLPGFHTGEESGGKGYKVGRVFKVGRVSSGDIMWEKHTKGFITQRHSGDNYYLTCGVYMKAVKKLCILKPIKQIKKHELW